MPAGRLAALTRAGQPLERVVRRGADDPVGRGEGPCKNGTCFARTNVLPTHRLRNPYDLVSTQSEGQLPHRISGAAQHEEEPVSDFIRRIERIFRSAYGRDPMSSETRETLLYGQLQEGLRLQLMRGPAVSGARNYQELCVAARNEEKRLADLRKRQEYSKLLANTSSSQRTVRLKPPADSGPSRGGLASPPDDTPSHYETKLQVPQDRPPERRLSTPGRI